MARFVVITNQDVEAVAHGVKEAFPDNHYALSPSAWLVAGDMLTETIYQKIDPSGTLPGIVVLSIESYWGRREKSAWEWLELKK